MLMRFFTANLKSLLAATVCLSAATTVSAATPWEFSLPLKAVDAVYVTSKGTVLAADNDYTMPATSGIHYSEDEGDTWTQASVAPWLYSYFFEAGDYVFAVGESGRLARSEDDGRTWTVLNYTRYIEEYVDPKDEESLVAYTASYDPDRQRIYLPVWSSTVGVIYSDDFGVTWSFTDRESLQIKFDEETTVFDSFYSSTFFNGKLQVYGIYRIYIYDAENDTWDCMRTPNGIEINTNFLAVTAIHDGVLYASRGMEDDDAEKPFVMYTSDMLNWGAVASRPATIETNYVRAIAHDGEYLYAATINRGLFRTKDLGQTWETVGEGLPMHPQIPQIFADRTVQLALSENYLFAAQHDYYNRTSGVYRVRRGDGMGEEVNSIAEIMGEPVSVTVSDSEISAPGAAAISVCAVTGVEVLGTSGSTLSTASLSAGVYVYVVTASNGSQTTGKFIKR